MCSFGAPLKGKKGEPMGNICLEKREMERLEKEGGGRQKERFTNKKQHHHHPPKKEKPSESTKEERERGRKRNCLRFFKPLHYRLKSSKYLKKQLLSLLLCLPVSS